MKSADERKGAAQAWFLQSPPGLALVLKKEMVFVGALERKQDVLIKRQRNHDLIFANRLKSDAGLDRLRIAEAVYRCPVFGRYKISKRQLDVLTEELRRLGPRRLIVQVAGRQFDRRDLSRWLEKEISARGYDFEDVEDEVWMFCIDEAFYFGIPITKFRQTEGREDRVAERVASLPPPIAAAMAFAGMPKNDDIVLDPVCGSGTLLAEARSYAPNAQLVGIDIDESAVRIARANLSDESNLKLLHADSRIANFENVTLLLANFPFGLRYGDRKTNAKLYQDILENVLRHSDLKKFRGILLSSDTENLIRSIANFPNLEAKELFRVKIRGELAMAILIKPRSS